MYKTNGVINDATQRGIGMYLATAEGTRHHAAAFDYLET